MLSNRSIPKATVIPVLVYQTSVEQSIGYVIRLAVVCDSAPPITGMGREPRMRFYFKYMTDLQRELLSGTHTFTEVMYT
jgi:hypothetical protein